MRRIILKASIQKLREFKKNIEIHRHTRRNNIRRRIKRSVCGLNLSVPLGFSHRIEPQHVATVISFEFLKRTYRIPRGGIQY